MYSKSKYTHLKYSTNLRKINMRLKRTIIPVFSVSIILQFLMCNKRFETFYIEWFAWYIITPILCSWNSGFTEVYTHSLRPLKYVNRARLPEKKNVHQYFNTERFASFKHVNFKGSFPLWCNKRGSTLTYNYFRLLYYCSWGVSKGVSTEYI